MAELWAHRATCPRRSVGCVIVDQFNSVVATGYNGAPRGMPHCVDDGCVLEGGHCVRALHAEINAIAYAARRGVSLEGCEAYCTLLPCIQCMQALLACGVRVIHFDDAYRRREAKNVQRLAALGNLRLQERNRPWEQGTQDTDKRPTTPTDAKTLETSSTMSYPGVDMSTLDMESVSRSLADASNASPGLSWPEPESTTR